VPNARYLSGRRREYQVMREYRERGYAVSRSAGSHGVWDVVAAHTKSPNIHLIQVKSVKSGGERAALRERAKWQTTQLPQGQREYAQILIVFTNEGRFEYGY